MTFQQLPIVGDCPFREKKKKERNNEIYIYFQGYYVFTRFHIILMQDLGLLRHDIYFGQWKVLFLLQDLVKHLCLVPLGFFESFAQLQ